MAGNNAGIPTSWFKKSSKTNTQKSSNDTKNKKVEESDSEDLFGSESDSSSVRSDQDLIDMFGGARSTPITTDVSSSKPKVSDNTNIPAVAKHHVVAVPRKRKHNHDEPSVVDRTAHKFPRKDSDTTSKLKLSTFDQGRSDRMQKLAASITNKLPRKQAPSATSKVKASQLDQGRSGKMQKLAVPIPNTNKLQRKHASCVPTTASSMEQERSDRMQKLAASITSKTKKVQRKKATGATSRGKASSFDQGKSDHMQKLAASILGKSTKDTKKKLNQNEPLAAQSSFEIMKKRFGATTASTTSTRTFHREVKLEHYWKSIRDWDFLQDLNDANRKQPQSNMNDDNFVVESRPTKTDDEHSLPTTAVPLPDTFESAAQYKALWSPLLLEEVRSSTLMQVGSELMPIWKRGALVYPVKVDCLPKTASSIKDTVHLQVETIGVRRQGNNQDDQLFFNDMVLLFPERQSLLAAIEGNLHFLRDYNDDMDNIMDRNDMGGAADKNKKQKTKRHGLVGYTVHTNQRKSIHGINTIEVSFKMWNSIGRPEMYAVKIGSNITALREFTALSKLDDILLSKYILKAKTAENAITLNEGGLLSDVGGGQSLPIGFRIYIKSRFNPSQIDAITGAAKKYGFGGFSLVKGPPGTGKTTTLVALLNSLHLRQYQLYHQEIEKIAKGQTSTTESSSYGYMTALNTAAEAKPRVLVCAPSNAAIDNVIVKITKDKFVDGSGGKYNPSIVRVGVGQSVAVSNVSLQGQLDSILAEGADCEKLDELIKFSRQELKRFQKEIMNLKNRITALATASPEPLSRDWEIRIDENAFQTNPKAVLFVNHKLKKSTSSVPEPAGPGEVAYPVEEMPHYRSLMEILVKYVERHQNTSSKLKQYNLVKETNLLSKKNGRESKAAKERLLQLETHVLNSAHIICTTLGTAGSKAIELADKFEVVVIDEAAQSSEPATLVALQLGSSHAVLMGDPQQLPATIFSLSGRHTKYDRSLFQRLEEAGHPVHLLNTQYRMNPAISDFPRRIFYDGRLLDGPNVKDEQYGGVLSKQVSANFPNFCPLTILDLDSTEERGGTSLSNEGEAGLTVHLYKSLNAKTNKLVSKCRVAVITPYSQQVSLLKRKFGENFGPEGRLNLDISTVDAFQGKEADIVIFSCVRASGEGGGIGFLSDVQRMNVALTRAKHFMFVIARVRTIVVNPYWKDLVETAKGLRAIIKVPLRLHEEPKFPALEQLEPVVNATSLRQSSFTSSEQSLPKLPKRKNGKRGKKNVRGSQKTLPGTQQLQKKTPSSAVSAPTIQSFPNFLGGMKSSYVPPPQPVNAPPAYPPPPPPISQPTHAPPAYPPPPPQIAHAPTTYAPPPPPPSQPVHTPTAYIPPPPPSQPAHATPSYALPPPLHQRYAPPISALPPALALSANVPPPPQSVQALSSYALPPPPPSTPQVYAQPALNAVNTTQVYAQSEPTSANTHRLNPQPSSYAPPPPPPTNIRQAHSVAPPAATPIVHDANNDDLSDFSA